MLVVALVVSAGCTEDVPTWRATSNASFAVDLAPPADPIPMSYGHYRWELVELPPGATDPAPSSEEATIRLTPRVRGVYAYDRWFVGPAAEQLSYHVILTVNGAPPVAVVSGPTTSVAGAETSLDGSGSISPENRPLTFQWRLAVRPESSTTELSETQNATLTLVPDVQGEYSVELRVFDGELWSQPATATLIVQ